MSTTSFELVALKAELAAFDQSLITVELCDGASTSPSMPSCDTMRSLLDNSATRAGFGRLEPVLQDACSLGTAQVFAKELGLYQLSNATAGVDRGRSALCNYFSGCGRRGGLTIDPRSEQLAETPSCRDTCHARIARYFQGLAEFHKRRRFTVGCLIGNMALEVTPSSEEVRSKLAMINRESVGRRRRSKRNSGEKQARPRKDAEANRRRADRRL